MQIELLWAYQQACPLLVTFLLPSLILSPVLFPFSSWKPLHKKKIKLESHITCMMTYCSRRRLATTSGPSHESTGYSLSKFHITWFTSIPTIMHTCTYSSRGGLGRSAKGCLTKGCDLSNHSYNTIMTIPVNL